MRKLIFVLALVLGVILLGACVAANTPQPDPQAADYNTLCYREIGGGKYVCASGGALEMQAGSTLTLAGRADFDAATTQTATTGNPVTVSAFVNPLGAASNVTPTITIPSAGTYGCFYNTVTYTVVFVDTGNQVLGGNASLGQYDWLCGYSDGTRFMQVAPEEDN